MGRSDAYRLFGPEHSHRFDPDQEHAGDHGRLDRRSRLGASPAPPQGYADGRVPLQIGSHPGAALDDDPATAWRSNPLTWTRSASSGR